MFLPSVVINYFGHSFGEVFAVQCSELKRPRNNSLTQPDALAYIQREIYCFAQGGSSSELCSVLPGKLYTHQVMFRGFLLLCWDRIFARGALEEPCGTCPGVEPQQQELQLIFGHQAWNSSSSGTARVGGTAVCGVWLEF